MVEIAESLRRARCAAALTQRQLADATGVSRVSVARYETGAVMPAADTYLALIEACRRIPARAALDTDDLAQIDAQLARTPEGRLHSSHEASRLRAATTHG